MAWIGPGIGPLAFEVGDDVLDAFCATAPERRTAFRAHKPGKWLCDLPALARHPVVAVSAGAKSFLDLPRTLEMLETLGVPVIGVGCDEFPAFTVRSSGLALAHRIDDTEVLARVARTRLQLGGGMLVCTPVPARDAVAADIMQSAIDRALHAASQQGVSGPAVTPLVLAEIAADTAGEAVRANLSLAENNARLAGELAVKMTNH